jgi:hydrogenase expression/formation protein HypC
MCLSIPMRVVEWLTDDGSVAIVERHGRLERLNMLLLGPQPIGTWVLASLGFAKEVVDADALVLIEEALAELAASLDDLSLQAAGRHASNEYETA